MTTKRKTARAKKVEPAKPEPKRISDAAIVNSRRNLRANTLDHHQKSKDEIFLPALHPPGVVPTGSPKMAMDDACGWASSAVIGTTQWGAGGYGYDGFIGYAELAILAQRPEYRSISEVIATEATRKWIELQSVSENPKTQDKIKKLNDALKRLRVQDCFARLALQDGFFGRSHLYLDTGQTKDRDELKLPLGNGRTSLSRSKVGKGDLKRLKVVEAVWCYPTAYNSNDPLEPDWYNPESWFVMGKQLHSSRFLTFIGREVPDLLKPAYSFGGLSLTQMSIPAVNNWLQTRQSVNQIISAFSTFVLATNLSTSLQGDGDQIFKRAQMFNNYRNNAALLIIDKESEDFKNVSASLASLDLLQAQAQEHMASINRYPLVKFLGIQPAGLNASSVGEIRTFYDGVGAYQEKFFRPHLTTVIDFVQLSEFGEVDPDITFRFLPLWSLDEKEEAERRKAEADTNQVYVDMGAFSPQEVREAQIKEPGSPFNGLDPEELPEPVDPEPGNIHERINEDPDETGGEIEPLQKAA